MVCYNETLLGKVTIVQNGNEFELEIRDGNCLSVIISVDYKADKARLYSFYADEQHLKNIIKHDKKAFWDDVVRIRLNLKHKKANILLKHYVKCGYEVTCYYE
jgi:hypothetical protein